MSTKLLRLKRFLYTGNEDANYRTGDSEKLRLYYRSKLGVVGELIKANHLETILTEVINASNYHCLPRPETVLFVLAVALRSTRNVQFRRRILTTLKTVCKSVKDLYKYLNFHIKCGGRLGVGIKKLIKEYFLDKNPLALAIELTHEDGCEGWEHKNIIEVSHIETDRMSTRVVLEYVLRGLHSAILCAADDQESEEIIKRFRQIEELKNCDNADKVADLIVALRCDISVASTGFHRNAQVWAAVVTVMPARDLLFCLPRLLNLKVLKPGSLLEGVISRYLTAEETIKSSSIEPLEVLTILTHFDNSEDTDDEDSDVTDEEYEDELPDFVTITNALYVTLDIVNQNRQPINKRFMVTIEVTSKMKYSCLSLEDASCLTAAVAIIAAFIRLEPNVTIAIFDGHGINYLEISPYEKLRGIYNILQRFNSAFVLPSAVFQSAIQRQISIDVFINLMSDFEWITTIPEGLSDSGLLEPLDGLEMYRTEMSLPSAMLISFSLSSPEWRIGRNRPGVLDVYGFDVNVGKVIAAFSKALF